MHHHALLVAGFAALAAANPAPQNVDFASVNAAPSPTLTGPAPNATKESVIINNAAASASGSAKVTGIATASATASQNAKRHLSNWGWGWGWGDSSSSTSTVKATSTSIRITSTTSVASTSSKVPASSTTAPPATTPYVSTPCATQPDGYGPKVQPDTVDAFLAYSEFASESKKAVTPLGYSQTFVDLNAAVTANTYLGLTTFTSYDVSQCGTLCDNTNLCTGFNIYVERDPSINPSDDCPNPASITNYKCTLWGSGVDSASATNAGQYRDQFQVVITGSNGYSKIVAPPTQPGWQPPQQCGGGSKAHSHPSTCLGQAFFPGPYNPAVCAGYATAQNAKNLALVSSWMQLIYKFLDYSPYECKFFNSYVLKKNGKPLGTYCSLFTQVYAGSAATYSIGVQGEDSWSCDNSYSYSISV
ncbi:hypothetical protein SBOR_10140 [Sclerotinia borealis F-4128]|uniref:Uncharacterized protein n=1 Tax=Sclerotinia borealis (strain F-4128) TaxID=1432307 RepID=W9C4I3_SCLBF|nr:hypothetical protein SBOR_10140 [Sclerotinia borealis F-4128]